MSEHVKALAERYGVALDYQDARGKTVSADLGVVAKLLQNMGVPTEDEEKSRATREEPVLPPAGGCRGGEPRFANIARLARCIGHRVKRAIRTIPV